MSETKENMDKSCRKVYPWPLLIRTLLLWYSFFVVGLSDSTRGPTLLDLKDLVNVSVSDISSTFAVRAFGGMVGCVFSGFLLDKLSRSLRIMYIMFCLLVAAISTFFLPFGNNILTMQIISFIFGVANGGIHSSSNVLLLEIWKDHNSSPYMYAMHFFFGAGALLAPVLSKPFLRSEDTLNVSGEVWTIKTLYPILAVSMLCTVPGYIVYFISEIRKEKKEKEIKQKDVEIEAKSVKQDLKGVSKTLLVILMAGFYFSFAGIEVSFRTFTATYAVSSTHSLTRHSATDLLAFFYTTFATFRALLIPISAVVSPTLILWCSLPTLFFATTILSVWGESSLVMLQLGVALVGAGVASVFASGMLWMRTHVKVTNKVGSVFTFTCSIASQTYTMLIGSYIEEHPCIFLHLMTLSSVLLILFFTFANCLVYYCERNVRHSNSNKN